MAGADHLAGKPLLDLSNALDHSVGFPPDVARDPDGEQRRADPGGVPGGARGQVAQHDEQLADGRPALSCPARTPRSSPATTRTRRRSLAGCCATWAGRDEEVLDLGDLSASRGARDVPGAVAADRGGARRVRRSTSTSSAGDPGHPLRGARPGAACAARRAWGFGDVAIDPASARWSSATCWPCCLLAPTTPGHPTPATRGRRCWCWSGRGSLLAGGRCSPPGTRGNGPVRDLALRLTWRSAVHRPRVRRWRALVTALVVALDPAVAHRTSSPALAPPTWRTSSSRRAARSRSCCSRWRPRSARRSSRSWRSAG